MKHKVSKIFAAEEAKREGNGTPFRMSVGMASEQGNPIISISGDIGNWDDSVTAKSVIADLSNALASKPKTAILRINSGGGDLFEAGAIYDYLVSTGINIQAEIFGLCASAATYIACAADEIYMGDSARWMVHRPTISSHGLNASELAQLAIDLSDVEEQVIKVYSKKTGKSADEIFEEMKKGSFLSAQSAIAFGWANGIVNKTEKESEVSQDKANMKANKKEDESIINRVVEFVNSLKKKEVKCEEVAPAAEVTPEEEEMPEEDGVSEKISDLEKRILELEQKLADETQAKEAAQSQANAVSEEMEKAVAQAAVTAIASMGADAQELPKAGNEPNFEDKLAKMSSAEILRWTRENPELAKNINI